jgi:flagellar biosynthesis protein FliR
VELTIDPGWMAGLALASVRTGAFVAASLFPGRFLPPIGRRSLALALALFLMTPVQLPTDEVDWIVAVAVLGASNAVIGATLGWLIGAVVHIFSIAGSVLDFTGGLYAAQLFDPNAGGQVGPFEQMLGVTSVVALTAAGALMVPVWALWGSVQLFALDGSMGAGMGAHASEAAAQLLRTVTLGGVEFVLPAVAVLIVLEATFGLVARLAPQANVLLISLPAKLLVVFTVSAAVMVSFPEAVLFAARTMEETVRTVLLPYS